MNIDHLANRLTSMGPQGISSILGLCGVGVLVSRAVIWCGKKVSQIVLNHRFNQTHPVLMTVAKLVIMATLTLALLVGVCSAFIAAGTIGLTLSSISSIFGPAGTSIGLIVGASLGVTLNVSLGIQFSQTFQILSSSLTLTFFSKSTPH